MSVTENQLTGESVHVRIISPELDFQSLIVFNSEDTVWQAKQRIISCLCKDLKDSLNYGLYCPSVNNRAGKFLDEERQLKDYPLPGPIGLLEFKYKRRLYKIQVNPSKLKKLHSPNNLKKFMETVCKGDADKITEELNKGIDPNFCDSGKGAGGGETPLTASASLSRPRAVMLALISGGAYLDFRNRRGMTALHVAAEQGNKDAIKTLLDLGASPNYKDGRGFSPLFSCVATGANSNSPAQCVQMLLHDRAEIGNRDDNGWTEIHHCCLHGRVQHLEHLLFYGADVNAKTAGGDTALHVCAKYNQEECARALMFRGADRSVRNGNSEDAVTLAHLAGNTKLAEVIGRFRPEDVVLYTELPKYNEKRRGTISLATIRNLQRSRSNPHLQKLFAPDSPFTASLSIAGGHQMLAANSSFALKNGTNGSVSNLSIIDRSNRGPATRVLLLQRDENGFGFVLRGAKSRSGTNEKIDFSPTSAYPALQYFDKIEPRSSSERAGLMSGDFLLEVNGEDVSRASHDHTVSLIRRSGNQVTLKVMTPDRQTRRNDSSASTTNHTFGRGWSPPSLSPSTASQMRSNLAGLEELERLDATLDQYENDADPRNPRSPSGTSLRGPPDHRRDLYWRRSYSGSGGSSYEPVAQGQHRSSLYVSQEEEEGEREEQRGNNSNNRHLSSNNRNSSSGGGARNSFEELEPDYENGSDITTPMGEAAAAAEGDNSEESSSGSSTAFAVMIKQATLNRERRVKERDATTTMMTMMTTTQDGDHHHHHQQQQQQLQRPSRRSVSVTSSASSSSAPPAPPAPPPPPPLAPLPSDGLPVFSPESSWSSGRRTVPPEVTKTLDENRKRDEAHAALMAAVLKRRSVLEDSGGCDQLAEDIETRLQRSRKIQVVYRGGGGGGGKEDSSPGSGSASNGAVNGSGSLVRNPTSGQTEDAGSRPSGARGGSWRPGGGGGGGGGTTGVPNGRSAAPFSSHQSNFVSVADLSVGIHGNDDAESTISTLSTLSTLSSPSAGSSPPPPSQPSNHHHHLLSQHHHHHQQHQQTSHLVRHHNRSHSLLDISRLPEGVTGVTAPLLPPPVEFSGENETTTQEGVQQQQPKSFNAVPVSATLRSIAKNPAGNSTVFPARINPEPPMGTGAGGARDGPPEPVGRFAGKAVDAWSVADVAEFLDSLDYGAYKGRFAASGVDGKRLAGLGDDDLERLGVDRILHRIKLGIEVRRHLHGAHLLQ